MLIKKKWTQRGSTPPDKTMGFPMQDKPEIGNRSDSTWCRLLTHSTDSLRESLWRAVIREIATRVLISEGVCAHDDDEEEEEATFEEKVDGRIETWMYEAFPGNADLAIWLGDENYFFDRGYFTWDERLCFDGDACPCASDIAWDLQDLVHFTAREITPEVVEEFFQEWRSGFLWQVSGVAATLG